MSPSAQVVTPQAARSTFLTVWGRGPFAAHQLQAFNADCSQVRGSYLADNTSLSYKTGQRAFVTFMIRVGRLHALLPVNDVDLANFVIYETKYRNTAVSSVKTYLFGIRALHLELGYLWTCWSDRFPVYQAFRACKRLFGDAKRQHKQQITLQLLATWYRILFSPAAVAHFGGMENCLTLWAVFLVMFFGLLRKDNATVGKTSAFNPNRCLSRDDFNFTVDFGLEVTLRHSKVIQFNQRCHTIGYIRTGSKMCVPSACERCFAASPPAPGKFQPAFRWKHRNGSRTALSHSVLSRAIDWLAQQAGLNPKEFSAKSFRRGGADAASVAGVNHELIKELGDWKSDAYLCYLARHQQQRLELPRILAQLARQF